MVQVDVETRERGWEAIVNKPHPVCECGRRLPVFLGGTVGMIRCVCGLEHVGILRINLPQDESGEKSRPPTPDTAPSPNIEPSGAIPAIVGRHPKDGKF